MTKPGSLILYPHLTSAMLMEPTARVLYPRMVRFLYRFRLWSMICSLLPSLLRKCGYCWGGKIISGRLSKAAHLLVASHWACYDREILRPQRELRKEGKTAASINFRWNKGAAGSVESDHNRCQTPHSLCWPRCSLEPHLSASSSTTNKSLHRQFLHTLAHHSLIEKLQLRTGIHPTFLGTVVPNRRERRVSHLVPSMTLHSSKWISYLSTCELSTCASDPKITRIP